MKTLRAGRKPCATCHHGVGLGYFYLLIQLLLENVLGKSLVLSENTPEKLFKTVICREVHQVSVESLGSDTHLREMSKVILISNEVRSTIMISM